MVEIGDVLVSLDVIERFFCCDLTKCKGGCCLEGDAGAPLEKGEAERIKANYNKIKPCMKSSGLRAVKEQGFMVYDEDGDRVTPLIDGKECAYSIVENGNYWCAIEKVWIKGESDFRKPISCYLYPIRVDHIGGRDVLNYHIWDVCAPARIKGEKERMPLYRFLKDPLVAQYGEDWYRELEQVAVEWAKEKSTSRNMR